jgi:hypothetical protein
MISIEKFIVFTTFLVFAIIIEISTPFENLFAQEEEAHQSSSFSSSPLPTLDDNKDDMIISEEICPPYCNPPPPIQELPQEQTR